MAIGYFRLQYSAAQRLSNFYYCYVYFCIILRGNGTITLIRLEYLSIDHRMYFIPNGVFNFCVNKMAKEKTITSYRLSDFLDKFGESVFSMDNFILFCEICNAKVAVSFSFY